MDFVEASAHEGKAENEDTHDESKRTFVPTAEVFFRHQKKGSGSNQSHDGRTHHTENTLNDVGLMMLQQKLTDGQHQDEWQPQNGQGCQHSTQDGSPNGIAIVDDRRVARVSGAVDADRSWCCLTDGNDVSEFSIRQPMVLLHHFVLNQRQHGISTSEIEDAYF